MNGQNDKFDESSDSSTAASQQPPQNSTNLATTNIPDAILQPHALQSQHKQQQQQQPGNVQRPNVLANDDPQTMTTSSSNDPTNKTKNIDQYTAMADTKPPTTVTKENQNSQINGPTPPPIKPLLANDKETYSNETIPVNIVPKMQQQEPTQSPQPSSPQKAVVTKVKLTDELNIFDWFRTTDIINQIAKNAKNSVDSVITTLDPGMKEYLYSGGNVNIMVIAGDSNCLVGPIRDAFQYVFGRATVISARCDLPSSATEYPVRTACGFSGAITVAKEKIKKLRMDTSNIPQNQVVVVVQPSLVSVFNQENANGPQLDEIFPQWFLTYCMIIEDPVLGATMSSYSQLIPIDSEIVEEAKKETFNDDFVDKHLGFPKSINELMSSKLKLGQMKEDEEDCGTLWLQKWTGLCETQIIHHLALALANLYRRKWNDCMVKY